MDAKNKRWYAKIQICPNSSYKQALTANTAAENIKLSTRMDPTSFIETHSLQRPARSSKENTEEGKTTTYR